jgi:hypothetical protein
MLIVSYSVTRTTHVVLTHHLLQWTGGAEYFDYVGDFPTSCRERVPSIPLALLIHAIVARLWREKRLAVFLPVRPCARILSLYRGSALPWDSHGLSIGFEHIHDMAEFPAPRADSSSYLLSFGQSFVESMEGL